MKAVTALDIVWSQALEQTKHPAPLSPYTLGDKTHDNKSRYVGATRPR